MTSPILPVQNLGRLYDLPRTRLFSGIPPLEAMLNLEKTLNTSANLFIKRDDCTELTFGGNKVRQLEFYLGEAITQQADTILITGAVQSNFVRLAAAGARKLGMDCHIQLEERVKKSNSDYHKSGNVFLDHLLGATMHSYPVGEDEYGADQQLQTIANELRVDGKTPYIIPLSPEHPPLGALGYVVAAQEILEQLDRQQLEIDEIVVASGSGATHSGLLFGLRALGSNIGVTGICVRRAKGDQMSRISDKCREIATMLDIENPVVNSDIVLDDAFLEPGYGQAGKDCVDAIKLCARTEALILDPTYTGKAMAGFIHRAKSLDTSQSLLFIHTGGAPAIFAYMDDLA
ncbi:D-cysteine desulfhydrase family protein [Sneathiella marina]|uniref:D-cysteine desulfhydrase family protein n=1 Tax=Sneathiella marina TaxID=2950108 RepID=A0ABY4W5U9_9PROT|nr:D-cysteine desulfhydrase family protein [Sneathiella marina]USG62565.1 D-cysteine desulfhydrase family protein [Sneathiella marina]